MARLLEHRSLGLLAERGVPITPYAVVSSVEEAKEQGQRFGYPVVVKAQVPLGGRGKGGMARRVDDEEELVAACSSMLGAEFKNFPVREVLISPAVAIQKEYFVSITFDYPARRPVILFSKEGGVDVEEIVRERPDSLHRFPVTPGRDLEDFEARQFLHEAGLRGKEMLQVATVVRKLYAAFRGLDAVLLEVNPLVLTDEGDVLAVSAVLVGDDRAAYRHPEWAAFENEGGNGWRPLTERELEMKQVDASDPSVGHIRFNEFPDGDIALMVTGGGTGAIAFDELRRRGLRPACVFDISNGQIEEKMRRATKLILSKPGLRGVLAGANFSNFFPVDIKARGFIRALEELRWDATKVPVVMRFCGPGQETVRALAERVPGVVYLDHTFTIEDAVDILVKRLQETGNLPAPSGSPEAENEADHRTQQEAERREHTA